MDYISLVYVMLVFGLLTKQAIKKIEKRKKLMHDLQALLKEREEARKDNL